MECRLKTNVYVQRLGVRWGLKLRNRSVLTLWITSKTENKRLLLSASFTAKFDLVFVLTQENQQKERKFEIGMFECNNQWNF